MSRFFLRAYLDDAAEVSSQKYGIVLAQPWAITGFGLFFFGKRMTWYALLPKLRCVGFDTLLI